MRASIFFLLLPLPPLLYSSLSFIIYYPSSACFDILLPYSRLVGCWDAPWFSFFFFWLPVSLIVFIWISSWCLKMLQDASGCSKDRHCLMADWLEGFFQEEDNGDEQRHLLLRTNATLLTLLLWFYLFFLSPIPFTASSLYFCSCLSLSWILFTFIGVMSIPARSVGPVAPSF